MTKKVSLVLAAVAVLVFAIPAIASASKATLNGELAPVGTPITATGTDVIFKSTLLSDITCATLNLTGVITKNDGTTVEGSGESFKPTQAGCKNGEKAVTVTSVNVTKLFSNESGKGTVSFVSKVDVGTLECTFTGENIKGTYVPGTDILTFSAASGVVGKPTSCGNATLSGAFTLESGSTPLSLD